MANVLLNHLRHSIKAYKFTVTSKNDRQLLLLKSQIRKHNAAIRRFARNHNIIPESKLLRVSLMARGKRRDSLGRPLHPNADSNLQHKYASRFDVYIHNDHTGNLELSEQIKTGLTTGQQRKAAKAARDLLIQEIQNDEKLRKQGIIARYVTNEYGRNVKQYLARDKYIEEVRKQHPNMPDSIFNRIFKGV
jgi:hypothetical protein